MSYQRAKQLVSGNIPPWQKVVDSAMSMGAAPLLPQSMEEFQDIPNIASNVAADFTTVPFTDIGPRKFIDIPEPQTEYGGEMRTAAGLSGLALGGVKAAKGIDDLIKNKEIQKVQNIQKNFGPWVKKYTTEYGKSFRGGVKNVIKGSKEFGNDPKDLVKKVQRIFNPVKRSDGFQDLPGKTQKAINAVYGDNVKPREVLNAANRLRKSPQAKKFDETGNLVRETGNKLKNVVKEKSPAFSEVDRKYGEFSGTKKVMEKFRPGYKGQGEYGTQAGTKMLRNINKAEPGDIKAMERFGNETGMNIVGPAKLAAGVRGIGSLIKKAAPWAGGGGAGYLLAKRLLGQQTSNSQY